MDKVARAQFDVGAVREPPGARIGTEAARVHGLGGRIVMHSPGRFSNRPYAKSGPHRCLFREHDLRPEVGR